MKSEVYCYASVQLQAAKRKIMSVIVEGTITTVTQALSHSARQSVNQSVSHDCMLKWRTEVIAKCDK